MRHHDIFAYNAALQVVFNTMRHSLYKFTTMRHYDVRHFVHEAFCHAALNHLTFITLGPGGRNWQLIHPNSVLDLVMFLNSS
jgi:hypothetical protein